MSKVIWDKKQFLIALKKLMESINVDNLDYGKVNIEYGTKEENRNGFIYNEVDGSKYIQISLNVSKESKNG